MSDKKTIYLLGDTEHADVSELITALNDVGVEVKPVTTNEQFSVVILCVTNTELSKEVWRALDANRTARILPAIFRGGSIPAIFAGIKPADFTKNSAKALADLTYAIRKFC